MSNFNVTPTLLCDFYKLSHRVQYPTGTEIVYSNLTPRASRIQDIDKVVNFGLQAFIKKYLVSYFNENFFQRQKQDVVNEYVRFIKNTLGDTNPYTKHIEELHDLGFLPIKIKAIKEGVRVPLRVPVLTIENTDKRFFWLTNFLETLMSCELWQAMTSATIANEYRQILDAYALDTVGNTDFVGFQGHDFSMRGMSSVESALSSGAGHLLSFVGTDTAPAILYHEAYYNADIENELVGTSIPATEHSVACSYGRDNEFEYYRHLITEVYPNGFVSLVSDTYDLWAVLTDFLPRLKDAIMARDGKVVIRPDSGNPVDIICGDEFSSNYCASKGVIELLWDVFGGTVNEKGYKELDPHIGVIYGDSITIERAKAICERLKAKGFASTNIVFGIGSYTYQMNTRDTFGFAMKATHVVVDGEERNIQKDPVTDDGTKKSLTGRIVVIDANNPNVAAPETAKKAGMFAVDGLDFEYQDQLREVDLLEDVFVDGKLVRDESLSEIRARLRGAA